MKFLAALTGLTLGMQALSALAMDAPSMRIKFPGQVLIDEHARRAELLQASADWRQQICASPQSGWPRHGPQKNITDEEQPGQGLALTLMQAASVHLTAEQSSDRRAARRAVIHNLRYWAKHKGLSRKKGELHANHFYNLDRTLLPVIISYGLVRDDPKIRGKDRDAIENWLEEIVLRRGPEREIDPRKVSARNNHSYLRASVTMAWGALEGDEALFDEGIQAYKRALGQLDEAASLPLEAARGELSLSYHRHSLASLVTIAEMAAKQGIDLYGETNSRGQDLHDLVDFLAKGLETPGDQDLFFLDLRGHGRHYMAWFEAYRVRFPNRPATRKIERILKDGGAFEQALLDDYSGAVMSCLFRDLASSASAAINN